MAFGCLKLPLDNFLIEDGLYIVCGLSNNQFTNEIYRLDLNTWIWAKLEPKGTKPLRSMAMTSWVSGNKLFIFGGYGNGLEHSIHYPESLETIQYLGSYFCNNQLVYYDCQQNSWNWPINYGIMPTPRCGQCAFSVEGWYKKANISEMHYRSLAFVFGGIDANYVTLNDLYFLDIETMNWKVLPKHTSDMWPEDRYLHSLTLISKKDAVLFGGCKYQGEKLMRGCWLLNIEECISNGKKEDIWTRCKHHEISERFGHKAVQEPSSQRVWIIGGFNDGLYQHADHIKELAFTAPPLKALSLESAAKHFEKLGPEIRELPKNNVLRHAIESKVQYYLKVNIPAIYSRYNKCSFCIQK